MLNSCKITLDASRSSAGLTDSEKPGLGLVPRCPGATIKLRPLALPLALQVQPQEVAKYLGMLLVSTKKDP